jgi:excinuclease ABC subunit A
MRRTLPESVLEEVGKLDPAAIAQVREEAWPDVRDADELHDVLHTLIAFPETIPVGVEAGDSPEDPNAELAVLTDRLALKPDAQARLRTALEVAFQAGRGRARVIAPDLNETFNFSAGMTCDKCGRAFPRPEPHTFSFYSPLGACPKCEGFGRIIELDQDKIIPNRTLTLQDGAIAC